MDQIQLFSQVVKSIFHNNSSVKHKISKSLSIFPYYFSTQFTIYRLATVKKIVHASLATLKNFYENNVK